MCHYLFMIRIAFLAYKQHALYIQLYMQMHPHENISHAYVILRS